MSWYDDYYEFLKNNKNISQEKNVEDTEDIFDEYELSSINYIDDNLKTFKYKLYDNTQNSVTRDLSNPYSSPYENNIDLSENIKSIHSTSGAFAAIRIEGDNKTLLVWGNELKGGNFKEQNEEGEEYQDIDDLSNIEDIIGSTGGGFLAKKTDGTLITWGDYNNKIPEDIRTLLNYEDIHKVYSNYNSYTIVKKDGTIITWGGNYSNKPDKFENGDTKHIISNKTIQKLKKFHRNTLTLDSISIANIFYLVKLIQDGDDFKIY